MSKKKQKLNDIRPVLAEIKKFIFALSQDPNEDEDATAQDMVAGSLWVMFSKSGYGSIHLTGNDAHQFIQILSSLVACADPNIISRKAIDKKLKDVIITALDINEQQPTTSLQQRIEERVEELRNYITTKVTTQWRVYLRVSGIDPTSLPSTFGGIEFITFDSSHFAQFKEKIAQSSLSEKGKKQELYLIEEMSEKGLIGKPVAIVEVQAIDIEAAQNQALSHLRSVVDIINFYSDILYPPKRARAQIFGYDGTSFEVLPVLIPGENPQLIPRIQRIHMISDFSMIELMNEKGKDVGSLRISTLLTKEQPNTIEERILSAMKWAGRATVTERNEEAFLLYAIALESLVMERNNETELGYRLKIRVAHLLGDNLDRRKRIRTDVTNSYKVRSAIVHQGSFEVSDTELGLMRLIAKETIVKILTNAPFNQMESENSLFEWFDNQLLS